MNNILDVNANSLQTIVFWKLVSLKSRFFLSHKITSAWFLVLAFLKGRLNKAESLFSHWAVFASVGIFSDSAVADPVRSADPVCFFQWEVGEHVCLCRAHVLIKMQSTHCGNKLLIFLPLLRTPPPPNLAHLTLNNHSENVCRGIILHKAPSALVLHAFSSPM